jgi:hypothetical protein
MRDLRRPALALALATALWPSVASAQAAKAGVVTALEGNVTVTRVSLAPRPLKFRDDVFVNDKIVTADQSIARMLLAGKAVVTVRERSTLTITEVPGKATVHLEAGKIALAVAREKMRPGDSIEIRAANAVAGIRGTVVVAEVSGTSAQAGGAGALTGTFWVLKGQIEALLASQPGSAQTVSAFQQFRAGTITPFTPAQLTQILGGLSLSRQPLTRAGSEQAQETALNSGISLASGFTGVAAAGGNPVPAPPPFVPSSVPILPGNAQIQPPAPPAPPSKGRDHCAGYGIN